jgi:hypothetical protein
VICDVAYLKEETQDFEAFCFIHGFRQVIVLHGMVDDVHLKQGDRSFNL